ncbi:YqaJ viral recombinase family protein [Gulosibacter bifidus]|uniref:YqaJ viral recombinase family protein n=1 Tax=Gulosibacter bifidus TaxID=272239 RepID=A0ABW5RJ59_9MICO|nr:YqaJ viral recombinase family protein [Gulosibacter bifidus]
MVVFRPAAQDPAAEDASGYPENELAVATERAVRAASDYTPLALSFEPTLRALGTANATEPADRETYTFAQTRPAGIPVTPATGTVWRAGMLDPRDPFDVVQGELRGRVLCADSDRESWLSFRRTGITATDAARLATLTSVRAVVNDKLYGGSFQGNAFTEFGRQREPEIAAWVRAEHGIEPCGLLMHAEANKRHLATPDGLAHLNDEVVLAEIKTTNKPWNRIPRNYLRQVWWQQYVTGASRTLFVWERHENFVVQDAQPQWVWIERDEAQIAKLVQLADEVLKNLALTS